VVSGLMWADFQQETLAPLAPHVELWWERFVEMMHFEISGREQERCTATWWWRRWWTGESV